MPREYNSNAPDWLTSLSDEEFILVGDAFFNPIFKSIVNRNIAGIREEIMNLSGKPEMVGNEYIALRQKLSHWEEMSNATEALLIELSHSNQPGEDE